MDTEARDSEGKSANIATLETDTWRIAEDVVECIVERLTMRDVCALRLCSHFFHSLCSSDHIWIQLFKQRWPCRRLTDDDRRDWEGNKVGECTMIGPCSLHVLYKLPDQVCLIGKLFIIVDVTGCADIKNEGWREAYSAVHMEMRSRAKSLIHFVRTCSRNESVEAYDYQKAMVLLSTLGLGFHDILMYLMTPAQSVLLNLIGLHFSLIGLRIQGADVKAALKSNSVGRRQVCLRWWTMGGWANGFRRRDEMHICTACMDELTGPAHKHLLSVMERGTVHEVLRVQISADFKSSAWVSRDMHSQR